MDLKPPDRMKNLPVVTTVNHACRRATIMRNQSHYKFLGEEICAIDFCIRLFI